MHRGRPGPSHRPPGWHRLASLVVAAASLMAACSTTQDALPTNTTRHLTLAVADRAKPIPGDEGSSAKPASLPAGVTANVDQRYSTNGRFDLYRSAKPTGALVVILPGRTSDKGIYSVFAGALATKGATVVVANYRARDLPPAPQTDLRCALATAVAGASKWGADPAKLVLVGVTWGVIPAIGEALDGPWKAYDAPTDCLIDPSGTKAVVRGVVGIVGQYDYYGASGDQTDNFKTFSPFSQLTSARKVPLRLLHGQLDDAKIAPSVTENFQQALQSNGFDSVAEISQLPNLALIGTRYDKTTKAAVAVSTVDPNALEPAVRLTLGLAG